MKIGIFDSGIGGLSVLHRALIKVPEAEYIYYADKAHVPYGEKDTEELKGYIKEILQFFLDQEVDGIIIACNTATSVTKKEFREQFPVPIVGMEPAVKRALDLYGSTQKRILVAATPITIAGEKLRNLLEKVDVDHQVDRIALPMLVRFAEAGDFNNPEIEAYLEKELAQFDLGNYEALVLGCTHFNYFKKHFRKVFPGEIHFVDGNEGTLCQLERKMTKVSTNDNGSKVTYYYSGRRVTEEEMKDIEKYMEQLETVYYME